MRVSFGDGRSATWAQGRLAWGIVSPSRWLTISACFLAVMSRVADADPDSSQRVTPDPPARHAEPATDPVSGLRPSWDLDGTYLWLGPVGAASRVDAAWDSTFGADLAVVRVRERARLGVVGVTAGASLWTERDGGRIWIDGIVGTRLGRMVGLTAGPIVELAALAHARLGASIGVWTFVGVTPFARLGYVEDLGGFGEVGVHIALPVLRK